MRFQKCLTERTIVMFRNLQDCYKQKEERDNLSESYDTTLYCFSVVLPLNRTLIEPENKLHYCKRDFKGF